MQRLENKLAATRQQLVEQVSSLCIAYILSLFLSLSVCVCTCCMCVCMCERERCKELQNGDYHIFLSKHQAPSELRRKLAILDCQLKKEQQSSKRYQVAVEMLLEFGEKAHEALTGTLDTGSQPIV